MHLFPSVTTELIKLCYKASKSTIYEQILVFKIKDAAKINKIGEWWLFGTTFTLLTLITYTK